MPIPRDVVEDVETHIGAGVVRRSWYARRIAAELRRRGFVATPDWLDANGTQFDTEKDAEIERRGR